MTATPTGSPPAGSVGGRVILERRASNAGAVVEVAGLSVTTEAGGDYLITGVPAGMQAITVRRPGYLRTWRLVSVSAGQVTALPDVTLLGGDVNGDDAIGQYDAMSMGVAWNTTPGAANWNGNADITADGAINVLDLVAVQYNWGRQAPGPWPGP
ncbi:MAG: carboxypeptidase regulatory-like domain-containing protein [Anaerolineae bacterium]